ncbi:MAG: helix-turn-helix transcriptional regulator [Chlamydiales bacterium]
MSAHTKTDPTNQSRKEKEDSIPWREASKDLISKYTETGMLVRGGRHKAGLTQKELAKKIGVLPHHISEMEHGKRPIGKKMAQKLGRVFNVDYRTFL